MSQKEISILFIEDNTSYIRLISEYLNDESEYSYMVKSCVRLSEGLNLLENEKYDVILLDLTLPDSERRDTLSTITEFTDEIPIVVLTGLDDKKIALESLQKGAQDYLVKDEVNSSVLTRSILYAIERHRLEKKREEKEESAKLDPKDKKILDVLQDNYKISYQDLSKRIGLAASTIHNRVQNLINSGVIEKSDTVVNPLKAGFDSMAFLILSVDPLLRDNIAKTLTSLQNIQLVASISGDKDLIVKVIARNKKELRNLIDERIKTIEGVNPDITILNLSNIYKRSNKVSFEP